MFCIPKTEVDNSCQWSSIAFQIERELVLSNDKGSTKIPLMHESRPSSSGMRRGNGIQHLLPRPHGAIAPDHPPKQMHAWVSIFRSYL